MVHIDGLERTPAPIIPKLSVNYHRDLVKTNSYLETAWREDTLKALDVTQPDGPSYKVTDGNYVEWQGWSMRVGFHYREGLVLHDVKYQGRPIMKRGSLVEMSVPYADPNPPYQRKCALDVGDYGLGYCANSLELGCDCLGHIHYFDATLHNAAGEPFTKKKVVCMHEEDDGILWKHVEYRNGHNESRRSRELVLSSIATVVNYEYLFYWRFKLDGSIDYEIRLTGELSTNLTSAGESEDKPDNGTLVAPGVNSQVHQHMFCARLDMNVDGEKNTVSEMNVATAPPSPTNPHGNVFQASQTLLKSEKDAVRDCDPTSARHWKISNAEGVVNPITKKPTAYKLMPFTRGPNMPLLLTHPDSNVSKKSKFATANLWVTKYDEKERYPAGEYPTQATMAQIEKTGGLPLWIERDADLGEGSDIVLWHSFGVTHIPRVEGMSSYEYTRAPVYCSIVVSVHVFYCIY
jgi:primary-amine oxidase